MRYEIVWIKGRQEHGNREHTTHILAIAVQSITFEQFIPWMYITRYITAHYSFDKVSGIDLLGSGIPASNTQLQKLKHYSIGTGNSLLKLIV